MAERTELDETRLGATSRALAAELFPLSSALRDAARMQAGAELDGHSLVIELHSPTGDASRALFVWIDETGVPSVEFGAWHTHDDVAPIVDIIGAILRDQLVLVSDVGGQYPGHTGVLDLRVPDALVEELTSKWSPGRVRIKSWSGKIDREVGVDDAELAFRNLEHPS